MKVYTQTDDLSPALSIKNPVVTIGVFDGLHRGHQQLIELVCQKANEIGGESVVVTFWPHPRKVLGKADKNFLLLTTMEEKKHLLESWGINHLVILPFTKEFAAISGREFILEILLKKIGMKYLVIGDDHRFGNEREGGSEILSGMGRKYGFQFTKLQSCTDNQSRISSSLIRLALKACDLEEANKLLGFPYFMFGDVIEGNKLGRKLGFRTANITCCSDNKQIPEEGVYVVKVDIGNEQFGGMLNIGTRPTVDHTMKKSIEVHIFDIDRDLYGKKLKVSFLHRLRDEMKFNNTDELRLQLAVDRDNALTILGLPAYNGKTLPLKD